jgi:ParB family chromosome partitioning protein
MTMEVKDILLSKITISDLNVRKNLDAGHEDSTLEDLAESIKENGLLNPVTVIQKGDQYELVVGQRRFLACQSIGFETIPAIIREDISDADGVTLSLIENVHRADMHPIDKGRAFQHLYDIYGSYQRVSKESGLSTPTIKRYMALLNLAPSIQEKLSTRDGPAGIGTLSVLAELFPNPEDQLKALDYISGFNQKVQVRILKQSKGDLGNLERDRELALGGEFDIHMCRGLAECVFIPDELREQIGTMLGITLPSSNEATESNGNWVDIQWSGDDGFLRFDLDNIDDVWGKEVSEAIENLRILVNEVFDEDEKHPNISGKMTCYNCGKKEEINKGKVSDIKMIETELKDYEFYEEKFIPLCRDCSKKWESGELKNIEKKWMDEENKMGYIDIE